MPRRQPTLADTLTSAAAGAVAGTLATFVMDKSLEAVFHVTGNDRHTEPQVLHQGSARADNRADGSGVVVTVTLPLPGG